MIDSIRRSYDISDQAFLTALREKYVYYENEHHRFHAVLPIQFPTDHCKTFFDLINHVQHMGEDSYSRAELMAATEKCIHAEKEFAKAFRIIRFIVEQAFPHEPDIRKQFGFGTAAKRQSRKAKQLEFADCVVALVDQYKALLMVHGCTDQMIQRLTTAYKHLVETRQAQTKVKQKRQNNKNDRIRLFNQLWDILVLIHDAAPVVFDEEETVRYAFSLPRRKRKKTSSPEEIHHDESEQ